MAITTLAQLKTAVDTYLNRSDQAASLAADYITLAEARFNRELPLRVNWTSSTPTGSVGSRNLALATSPAYVEALALFLTTYSPKHIELIKLDSGTFSYTTANGIPKAWCIVGTNIELDKPCDQAHTFLFRYRQAFNLSVTDPNWLLLNHPDVYLYGALFEACLLTKNEGFGAVCKQKMDEGMAEVRRLDARNNNAILLPDAALSSRGGRYIGSSDMSI